jgi:hypothetical protein
MSKRQDLTLLLVPNQHDQGLYASIREQGFYASVGDRLAEVPGTSAPVTNANGAVLAALPPPPRRRIAQSKRCWQRRGNWRWGAGVSGHETH